MGGYPEDVVNFKQRLDKNTVNHLTDIANILIDLDNENQDIIKMWHSLEKRKNGDDDLWIWSFLEVVNSCSNFQPYYYKSNQDRKDLRVAIDKHARSLISILRNNKLEAHIFYADRKLFNGFYFYEDFGFTDKCRIDESGVKKIAVTELLEMIAEKTKDEINQVSSKGKTGVNIKAIRFIRGLAGNNKLIYKQELLFVIATATNAIFETNYTESSIQKILTR